MRAQIATFRFFPSTQLIEHLRTPLYRNGYALVLSSAVTSGLGVLYWVLAAHNYTTEAIGLNSAALSSILFLANLAQLNLMNVLNRFIPSAGQSTKRLVLYAYGISAMAALMTSVVFVLGVKLWAPKLQFIGASPLFIAWFTLATMAWCIFVLQDSALTGLRQATWVPIENTIFALAKIGVLLALVQVLPAYGVLASWTVPLAITIVPVNLLIFRRLIPQHVNATKGHAALPTVRQIGGYIAGDYMGSLIWFATTSLLPVVVTELLGATANAHYYLSWTIAYSLYLVSLNMGQALIAESAADPSKLALYSYRTFLQTGRLLIPMVAATVIGAPYILRVFGNSYSMEGTVLLRLLALSALPNIVTTLYTSVARVQQRMMAVVLVLSLTGGLALTLSYFLLGTYGITGVGMGWLVSQSVMATFLLLRTSLRHTWLSHVNMGAALRWLAIPRNVWWYWRHRVYVNEAARDLSEIVRVIPWSAATASPGTWTIQRLLRTFNDVIVIALGPEGEPPVAILKVPQTRGAVISVRRHVQALVELHANDQLGEWRALLPAILAHEVNGARPYVLERVLPGLDARYVVRDADACLRLKTAAVVAIAELHRRTAASAVADRCWLGRWVDEPLRVVREALQTDGRYVAALRRLEQDLHAALEGRTLTVSWVHGDFVPENILVASDASTITGIVDWERAAPGGLPQLDVLQLLLSTRMSADGRELGDVVREVLTGSGWTAQEKALLAMPEAAPSDSPLELRVMILLCWLHHVSANLSKSIRYAHHPLWISKNVKAVLQLL